MYELQHRRFGNGRRKRSVSMLPLPETGPLEVKESQPPRSESKQRRNSSCPPVFTGLPTVSIEKLRKSAIYEQLKKQDEESRLISAAFQSAQDEGLRLRQLQDSDPISASPLGATFHDGSNSGLLRMENAPGLADLLELADEALLSFERPAVRGAAGNSATVDSARLRFKAVPDNAEADTSDDFTRKEESSSFKRKGKTKKYSVEVDKENEKPFPTTPLRSKKRILATKHMDTPALTKDDIVKDDFELVVEEQPDFNTVSPDHRQNAEHPHFQPEKVEEAKPKHTPQASRRRAFPLWSLLGVFGFVFVACRVMAAISTLEINTTPEPICLEDHFLPPPPQEEAPPRQAEEPPLFTEQAKARRVRLFSSYFF